MAETPIASNMSGGSTSGSSPIDAGLSKASSGLSKVIAQLTKVESLLKSIGSKGDSIGKHTKGANVGGGSTMMPSSLGSFSTNHMSGGNVLEGSLAKFGAQQAGLAIAGGIYGMLPQTSSAISTAAALQAGSSMFLDSYNPQGMGKMARASFGNNQSSNVSAAQAAATLAMSGMNPNGAGGRSIMATAGVAYQAFGMDNVTAAAALNNMYGGARGSAMMGIGVRTRDNQGNPLPIGVVVNQLYNRLYAGHKTNTSQQMANDFQAGKLGDSLTTLGITDPNERQQYLLQFQMKANAVRTGTTYDSTKVPDALMNDKTNPFLGAGKKNSGEANSIDAAMPGLVQGVNDANSALGDFQNKLADTIHALGDFGQALARAKGAGDTVAGTSVGEAARSLGGDALHFFEARTALKALGLGTKNILGKHSPVPNGAKGITGIMRSMMGKLRLPGLAGIGSKLAGLLPEGAAGSSAIAGVSGMLGSPMGKALLAGATYLGLDQGEELLNTYLGADKDSGMFRKGAATASRIAFDAGKGGVVGLELGNGNPFAGAAGSVAGLVQGLYNAATGQGMDYGTKGSIGSYAVGSYELPKDEVAQVHKGEMILPASIAQAVRTSLHNSSSKTSGGHNVQIQVMLTNGTDADVMRVGRKIKSIIEDPTIATSMKER
jgi:hypothetical protein